MHAEICLRGDVEKRSQLGGGMAGEDPQRRVSHGLSRFGGLGDPKSRGCHQEGAVFRAKGQLGAFGVEPPLLPAAGVSDEVHFLGVFVGSEKSTCLGDQVF